MAKPTVEVRYAGRWTAGNDPSFLTTYSSDVVYPLSFSYGFNSQNPASPHVASPGGGTIFFDNTSSDLPYTIHDSDIDASTDFTGKQIGANYRIGSSDGTDAFYFHGYVQYWEPVPGLVGDRVTEVTLRDFIGALADYQSTGLTVKGSVNAQDALHLIYRDVSPPTNDSDDYLLPQNFPGVAPYSSNGETFVHVFQDIKDAKTPFLTAYNRIAGSELGHVYCDNSGLYYKTHDEWINLGRTSIGTLDNRFLALETVADHDLEFAPVYVSYTPSAVSDTNEVLFTLNRIGHVKPGETTYLKLNYTDPNNKNVTVACIDSDVISPVDGTDYLVSYTHGDTDNAASSDLTINLTNKGSAAELEFINSNSSDNLYLSLLQVRGKPVFIYDQETIFTTDITEAANSAHIRLPYFSDTDTAIEIRNYYQRLFSDEVTKNYARSITFQACADTDTLSIAHKGQLGKSVYIKEDVNIIDGHYRITNIGWDILGPEDIVVSWDLYPEEYNNLVMIDENAAIFCDSTGADFAFWR